MKIAVINEVSASLRNEDIMKALHKTTDAEIEDSGADAFSYLHPYQLYGSNSSEYRKL